MRKSAALLLFAWVAADAAPADRPLNEEDYNQWKKALGAPATAVDHIRALPGFEVELIRAARAGEGSWVSFAFDPKGRVVIGREDRGLLRLELGGKAELFATNLLECRGLLFAFDALYANANNSKGLYRLRDTDGDDAFDEVKLLKATPGGVGHGRNDLVLGPDNLIYSVHGDDVGLPKDWSAEGSPFRRFAPDGWSRCEWEGHLYGEGVRSPGGHVIRTDREGRTWQLVAGGLRNAYGLDFNAAGDLFTYDADLEWDIGLPWYHPTRVLHVVSGADYGWRRTTANLPPFLPDSRPAVVDIGKGSPTAIRFGTRSHFPGKYRKALFVLDWAYGRIFAVHLAARGASYTGSAEVFLQGRPLNVTDLEFGPDGAMYFITGGRKTQSGLYRVRSTHAAGRGVPAEPPSDARNLRQQLEQLTANTNSLRAAWKHLNHEDSWVRHAARVLLERQPPGQWQDRALNEGAQALLALARTGPNEMRERILEALKRLRLDQLGAEEKLAAVRAYAIVLIRFGKPEPKAGRDLAQRLAKIYPDVDTRVNQQLCELLVYLGAPPAVGKSIALLRTATTPEEKLHFLFALRGVRDGWNLDQRRTYFETLREAHQFPGAHYLPLALRYIKREAEATLTENERTALKDLLAQPPAPAGAVPDPTRVFVMAWGVNDLQAALAAINPGRDRRRGRELFYAASCGQCHVYAGEGSAVGPDLTGVGGRFGRRDLLEAILEPSKVVAEIYRNITVATQSGAIHEGRFIAEDNEGITLAPNPADADHRWRVLKRDIESQQISELSSMPTGLLDTFTQEEILDLLAFLEFGR